MTVEPRPFRLPLLPTLIVAAAVAAMIALGIWQLHRAQWKEALIARYAHAATQPPIAFPTAPFAGDPPLYRYATGNCLEVVARRAIAGESRSGEPGYSHIVSCRTGAEGPGMAVDIGWSKNPNAAIGWKGGLVSGIIAPDRVARMRLVADGAAPGLQPSAKPSLDSIPNNHRSYAVQWFLFAAVALTVYVIALRRRPTAMPPKP
ncbi:MAG: SURF1 family protein [Sphingomicrobium sp.]|nr:SURF1 family protein [Sphingomonadales bacterium]